MFEFGDELIIESYRIPWLIWIQLLVMVLLVILLFCFSITANPSVIDTATTSNNPLLTTATGAGGGATSFSNFKQVGENQIKENQTSTSRVIRRTRNEDIQQMEDPSSEDGERRMILEHSHHPCHIFGLAKQVFLKCLGFDSVPEESSSERRDRKDH